MHPNFVLLGALKKKKKDKDKYFPTDPNIQKFHLRVQHNNFFFNPNAYVWNYLRF